MREVIEHYGKFILESMVAIALMTIIFISLTDSGGNKGIYAITGAQLDISDQNYHTYTDFKGTYKTESEKAAPKISFESGRLVVGVHALSNYIKAVDYAGNTLALKVISIKAPDGTEIIETYNPATTNINMSQSGIYTVTLSALDDINKSQKVTIQIPINREGEI